MNIKDRVQVYDFFITNANHSSKSKKGWLIRHYFDLYEIINNSYSNEIPFIEKIWLYINNHTEVPKCPVCGKLANFRSKLALGYSTYCSKKCMDKSTTVKSNRKKTMIKNFGVEHALQSELLMNKMKDTIKNRFRVDNVSNCKSIIDKKNDNNYIKYGVKNVFQLIDVQKTIKDISVNKFINNISKKFKINPKNIEINGSNITISNYCIHHPQFTITKENYYNRIKYHANLCTECFPIGEQSSIKEIEVRDYIKNELNFNVEKIKINNNEIDIYVNEFKLGIEFNGLYWHSNLYKDINYHLAKTELCNKNNIKLLHVFEDEWVYKKEIVKNIIKSNLNIYDNIISFNECIITVIDNKTANEFFIINHIDGAFDCKINIGLFYNEELVSAMGINYNSNVINIQRTCDRVNFKVINSFNKMLNFLIKTYNPTQINYYLNRRFYNDSDTPFDFSFVGYIIPIASYFRKGDLIRTNKENLNFDNLKIYDCGLIKTELNLF